MLAPSVAMPLVQREIVSIDEELGDPLGLNRHVRTRDLTEDSVRRGTNVIDLPPEMIEFAELARREAVNVMDLPPEMVAFTDLS